MRILMIGDVIGKPGRRAVKQLLPSLRSEHGIDLVIANGENTAGGFGLTLDTANELLDSGVDLLTSGNHIWDQKEIIPYLDEGLPLVRPANYPDAPGRGSLLHNNVLVINLMGRVFMPALGLPLPHRRLDFGGGRSLGTARLSLSSTFMLRPRRKNRPWVGTWTEGSVRSWGPTPMWVR